MLNQKCPKCGNVNVTILQEDKFNPYCKCIGCKTEFYGNVQDDRFDKYDEAKYREMQQKYNDLFSKVDYKIKNANSAFNK